MMKTLLFAALAATGLQVSAQCVPNQMYADSVYGVWPDTTENFVNGMVNVLYSDTLTLLVPSDASLIDPTLPPVTLDSVQVDEVTGLPPGITVSCNSQTGGACTYLPEQVGCGLLEGTPTTAGTYPITINVTAFAQVFNTTQSFPQSFGGYSITITSATSGIGDIAILTLDGVKNTPNPFTDHTTIEFNLAKAGVAQVKVFNLVGEQLWKTTVQGKSGSNRVPFAQNTLENGIYLYSVEAGGVNFTGRMMVNR